MLSNELVARPLSAAPGAAHAPIITPAELPLGLEIETRRGLCWRIDAPVDELWPEQERWLAALARRKPGEPAAQQAHEEIAALRAALPDKVVLIDLETIGSSSEAAIVLAGALHVHKGLPIVTQLIARSADEEPALLTALDDIFAAKQCLLTFNGKGFDWPALQQRRARLQLGREPWPHSLLHCDLLFHARRRWKTRLPNCKLQTLEQYVCGRQRGTDPAAPSAFEAYQQFAQTGATRPLHAAMHHHAMDLITLWQLALWMAHA